MSIVNVFVNSRRAVMLSDSSLYLPDATIVGFEKKAFPVDSWNGAISGRGNTWGIGKALELAEAFASFDEFVARSGPLLAKAHKADCASGDLRGQTVIEVHVIGWSEREDRAKGFVLDSLAPSEEHGHPPYVWRDHDASEAGIFHGFLSALELWRLQRQGAQPDEDFDADTFDPMRHGIPLIEAQRRDVTDAGLGVPAGIHVVGGDVWLTVVDREGTRQDIIHSWPDHAGEPIKPAPFDDTGLPMIAPTTWGEGPEAFFVLLERGAIDPETLVLDNAKLDRILEEQAAARAAKAVSRGRTRRAEPASTAPRMSRDARRAAAAKARKVGVRV